MNIKELIEVNPKKMSGTPVFRGTRVPIQNLFDCLEDGETVEQFLEQFPTVTREQVSGVLELSKGYSSEPRRPRGRLTTPHRKFLAAVVAITVLTFSPM